MENDGNPNVNRSILSRGDEFRKKYVSDNKLKYIIIIIAIVFFAIIFLQVVCTDMLNSNPSGCTGLSVASSCGEGETLDPYCVGCTEILTVVLLCLLFLFLGMTLAFDSAISRLIKGNKYSSALLVNKKEEPPAGIKSQIYMIELTDTLKDENRLITDPDKKLELVKQEDLLTDDESEEESEEEDEESEEESEEEEE